MALTFGLARPEGWDDSFYVAQMTSLVGDGDLLLQDDLLAFPSQDDVLRLRAILFTTEDGGVANMFGIGPAILHSTYLWPSLRSSPEIGQPFRVRIGLVSMALLAIVAVATRTLLVRLGFSEGLATICSLGSIFWGPLAIYGTRLYLNSHLPSAVWASLLALLCWDWVERGGAGRATLIGFCCGMAAVVRFQDALLGLAMAPFLLLGARQRADRRRAAIELALAATAFALVVSIQVLAFDRQSGRIFGIPQGPDFMRWTQPQLGRFLLSPYHGLVPWTPVFALGLLALPLALRRADDPRKRLLGACLVALVVAECYVSAATWDWAGGSSFSARRLSSVSMAAAVGLATLLSLVRRRLFTAGLLGLASAWALVAASLFVANVDDLNLLLHGQPSSDNPRTIEYPSRAELGPLHFLGFMRGGFSLVDPNQPSLPHRAIGLGLCLLVCTGVVLAWRVGGRYPRLLAAIAAGSVAWASIWALAVWRAPSNAGANRAWRQIVTGTASDRTLDSLPPEIAAAGRVVLAWKALRSGQLEAGRRLLSQAPSPQFPPLNLVDLALLDEAKLGMPTR